MLYYIQLKLFFIGKTSETDGCLGFSWNDLERLHSSHCHEDHSRVLEQQRRRLSLRFYSCSEKLVHSTAALWFFWSFLCKICSMYFGACSLIAFDLVVFSPNWILAVTHSHTHRGFKPAFSIYIALHYIIVKIFQIVEYWIEPNTNSM